MTEPIWTPSDVRIASSAVARFISHLNQSGQLQGSDQRSLYQFSIDSPEIFWAAVWDFCEVKATQRFSHVHIPGNDLIDSRWFVGASLNFAENLLRRRDTARALLFYGEDKIIRELSFSELAAQVAALAAVFNEYGIQPGDRVCGVVPNTPEAIVCMLATAACGGVWSSCSPDFGVDGVVERFGQITPKILIAADGYYFKGQWIDLKGKTEQIAQQLTTIEKTVIFSYMGKAPLWQIPRSESYSDIVTKHSGSPLNFVQLPAEAPLYILYSSGTTGKPKCIVHSVAGTLLEHLKEHILHTDIGPSDIVMYQTACSWMMWNWMVSALASGASLVLYDGSPLINDGKFLFDIIDQASVTIFGTNPKYLSLLDKQGFVPCATHNLKSLRSILSTGSPLLDEGYDYVYQKIKSDICLASISGGTDIIGCFVLGSPLLPVYKGEIQTRSLGLRVDVFNEQQQSVMNQKGELVCTAPFPSMPSTFYNDPQKEKYRQAYFPVSGKVWQHGDYALLTERGGMQIFGRSDATIKPGGVRIGTAEIYRQVEKCEAVLEALAVGQRWKGDTRIVLFVVLRPGILLGDDLRQQIRTLVKTNASPFHVPKKIIQVAELPRTRSGKLTELAIRDIIHGQNPKNTEALSNPQVLEAFKNLKELEDD